MINHEVPGYNMIDDPEGYWNSFDVSWLTMNYHNRLWENHSEFYEEFAS